MWYQLCIQNCPTEQVEALGDLLENQGALSTIFTDKNDDPILEPEPGTTPLWPEVVLQAVFEEQEKACAAQQILAAMHPEYACTLEILPDKDWQHVVMDDFKPVQFGEKLWICPSWSELPDPQGIHVMLDPGLAFGTGTHPTTALCLEWLATTDLKHQKIVDFGCGSGILALAALKLGAAQVFAVDIDPQALQATQKNAAQNHIPENTLICGNADILEKNQHIIIANILLQPLLTLYPDFHQLLTEGGTLVVSGLLREQVPQMIETCQALFHHEKTMVQEDWALIVFKRL